ncbi:gamma-glutamyl-gamma-aminobutyrate hydrolase family protein [Plantibacter sp. lyk4-40-MEA-4]|uniref:gamma-glutamyl-gamma-aminobutyrate hydrolase family protein n=1 Tax=Plantibacter sp. lyk4-40-MEA-4 TaxID=3040298 RepID=UPI00254BE8F8|nr:gamma-glutamyl-gamma-aminobutyrate hydrolase family protein [Plantibacter sp. lyk4-40-MEA-4]
MRERDRPTRPPRIGITARFDPRATSFRVDERYVRAIVRYGGVPLVLPFAGPPGPIVDALDGLMLTGGEDLHPRYSGGSAQDGYRYYPDAGSRWTPI